MLKFLFLIVGAVTFVAGEKHVVCYYGTWATYRSNWGKFDVSHINPDLCTHLIYTFVGLRDDGSVVSLDPYLDFPDNWGRNNFGAFNALKTKNPKLKTLLAVGGWNEGSAKFSIMAANPTRRHNFITSSIKMIQEYGFDGLDLDWEYPNRRDSVYGRADIDNFTLLLKELRAEFDGRGLLLTAAVSAVKEMASLSYNIPEISKYLDLINIMAYDMYGAWDTVTGHNAPLHAADSQDLYTVDVALQYWINQGAPVDKLVIGVPFYGRTFTLSDPNNAGVRAPSAGAGISGPYTATNGFIGYNELCTRLISESWKKQYDGLSKVPYASNGRNWVSYDDADSITLKIEYALKYNIGGVMIWSIETDDFHGLCGDVDFPLLRAVNAAVNGATVTSTTLSSFSTSVSTSTMTPSIKVEDPTTLSTSFISVSTSTMTPSIKVEDLTTVPLPPSEVQSSTQPTSSAAPDIACKDEGLTSNPADCSTFFICVNDGNRYSPILFSCPSSLYFDKDTHVCNYPQFVHCDV